MDTNENHHQTPQLHCGAATGTDIPIDEAYINGLYDGHLTFQSLLTNSDDHQHLCDAPSPTQPPQSYLFFNPSDHSCADFASSSAASLTHLKPEQLEFVDYNDVVVPASPQPYDFLAPFPAQNDAALYHYHPDDVALFHHSISPSPLGTESPSSSKTISLARPAWNHYPNRFVPYNTRTGPAAPPSNDPQQIVPFQLCTGHSSSLITGSLTEPAALNRYQDRFVPYNHIIGQAAPPSAAPYQILPSQLGTHQSSASKTGILTEPASNRVANRSRPATLTPRKLYRQRISDKMKSLQKLLPLEKRVTKASMLEEACKYIKFLEAQVNVLRSMPCYPARKPPELPRGEKIENSIIELLGTLNRQQLLQIVVNSPVTQSVLYDNGCCVYSAEQVDSLSGHVDNVVSDQEIDGASFRV